MTTHMFEEANDHRLLLSLDKCVIVKVILPSLDRLEHDVACAFDGEWYLVPLRLDRTVQNYLYIRHVEIISHLLVRTKLTLKRIIESMRNHLNVTLRIFPQMRINPKSEHLFSLIAFLIRHRRAPQQTDTHHIPLGRISIFTIVEDRHSVAEF